MYKICWLCEWPITKGYGVHPLSLSDDHVVPLKAGGWGGEKRPAHRVCNNYRRHLDVTEEVRMECRRRVEALQKGGRVESAKDRRRAWWIKNKGTA